MNPADFEETGAFKALHGCKKVRQAIPKVIEEFGNYSFTRSHVVSVLSEMPEIRKREITALDSTVAREIHFLIKRGLNQKTGESKFNRDMYRRVI